MNKQDVVVIGGGYGGVMVALGALQFGLKVTLINKDEHLGGTSVNYGCIPSKSLLHTASIVANMEQASNLGASYGRLAVDLQKINANIAKIVDKVGERCSAQILRQNGGRVIIGQGFFLDKHTFMLNQEKISSRYFVIATGSRPCIPEIKGLENAGYLTNESLFSHTKLPKSIIVLGNKPSAIEFAQALYRLGSKVTIICQEEYILGQEDFELTTLLKNSLISQGINFITGIYHIKEIYKQNNLKVFLYIDSKGKPKQLEAEEILIATGRSPNVHSLGLENANINYNSNGILVDNRLRTSKQNIFALGDVVNGGYKLTHVTEHQANIVLSNLVFGFPAKVNLTKCPYVIFTDPEFAHIGLTEHQAVIQKITPLKILRYDFKDIDGAISQNKSYGRIKVLLQNRRIIGVSILGASASQLIMQWALAIQLRASIDDIAKLIYPYPSLAQINKRVAHINQEQQFCWIMQQWAKTAQRIKNLF